MAFKPHFCVRQQDLGLSAARPISIQWVSVTQSVAPHDHDYDEISVLLSGRATHQTAERREQATPGTVITLAPGQTHAFDIRANCEFLNIYYLSEWLADDLREAFDSDGVLALFASRQLRRLVVRPVFRPGQLDVDEMSGVKHDASDLSVELKRERPSRLFLKVSFIKLLIRLNRAFRRAWPTEFQPDLRPEVRSLMEQMEQELTGRSGAACAGRNSSLTKGHVARLFKAEVGYSPTQYFQRRRTLLAANLILETTLSIGEIARRAGFSDPAHLARIFKREKGLSPRQFRNTYAATDARLAFSRPMDRG